MFKKKDSPSASEHDQSVNENAQPLLEHLLAMRKLLIACFGALAVGFVVAFYFLCSPVMDFITSPIEARGVQVIYTAVSEAFTTQLKVSLVVGVILVSPFLFYQIWAFVKPALYDNEIRLFRALFFLALGLFSGGYLLGRLIVDPDDRRGVLKRAGVYLAIVLALALPQVLIHSSRSSMLTRNSTPFSPKPL